MKLNLNLFRNGRDCSFGGFTPLERTKREINNHQRIEPKAVKNYFRQLPLKIITSLTGFTLIEIIIALTILAIGLTTVLAFLPVVLDASKKTADLTKASLVAYGLIEEIKAASYNDISQADNFDTAGSYVDVDMNKYPYSGIKYRVGVNPKGVVQIKNINVEVQWSFKGRTLTDSFQTQIVKYNPT